MVDARGTLDLDERYRALSAAEDPLGRLASVLVVEVFRAELGEALARRSVWSSTSMRF
ncbi:MAG: hypothetical protein P9C48_12830 [Defluviicoccus sp.]|nr:hypothetical protein [Defluviicoccus sp.]MDG4610004.1 hypothetical protein [Defluviicoccus sp.]